MPYPLVIFMQAPRQILSVVGSLLIPAQANTEVSSFDHQKEEVKLRHFPKLRQSTLVVSDW